MAYRKKYEDTYLDDEIDEFDGDNKTDAEKVITLIKRPALTPKDEELVKKLTERMFVGAKLPGPPGVGAIAGLQQVAMAYADLSAFETAAALWERIADVAGEIGNKDLYYHAMDEMSALMA